MSKLRNDYNYGWQQLHGAVHCLAGSGIQRLRLAYAAAALHNHTVLQNPKNHLPKEIRDEYIEFVRKMSSVKATGDEGNFQATVNTLDEMEMNRATEKILSFYDTICRYQRRH
ncbi:MAG: hypothetical protein WAK60_00205 [Sedimentisphaerales bacterium]